MKNIPVVGAVVIAVVFFVGGALLQAVKPGFIPFISTTSAVPLLKTGTYALQGYRNLEASVNDAPDYTGTITIDHRSCGRVI